ncbi:hypothetical protein ABBQ38_015137 [Trebouxia sp. C0009 RCD-2024]
MPRGSKSVNRPPTPEPEDQQRELSLEEDIRLKLIQSGTEQRLKDLLVQRLLEAGWTDNVRERMRDAYTARKQSGQVPQPEDLVKEVRSFGRSTVPDIVKAELLAELRDFIA